MKRWEIFEGEEWESDDDDWDAGVDVIERPPELGKAEEITPKRPKSYMCVLHNDPYTHAVKVVELLRKYFGHNEAGAWQIMMQAHQLGKAPCGGPYTKDVAETKANQIMDEARAEEFPLLISVEEVSND